MYQFSCKFLRFWCSLRTLPHSHTVLEQVRMHENQTFFPFVTREYTSIFQSIEPNEVKKNSINCIETGSVYILQDSVGENVTTPI